MRRLEHYIVSYVQTTRIISDTFLCSVALAVFAFFINFSFPANSIAFIALLFAAFIISRDMRNFTVPPLRYSFTAATIIYCIIGFQMGVAGALYYRGSFGMPVLPSVIRNFVWVAICIGITEELVFRGFIQGMLSKLHPGFAIVLAALAHATYKACLFISPAADYHYSVMLFYTWSLGAFILIGVLRYYSKSILPAIIAHAVFELVVYAENLHAPWWVW
jgi:membrane protease YdiL (CAAX protease family)